MLKSVPEYGLAQEKRNLSVLAIELRFSCTNPLTFFINIKRLQCQSAGDMFDRIAQRRKTD